jgi:cupin superfamily acireductone dioxygenase involved in methionine salvage
MVSALYRYENKELINAYFDYEQIRSTLYFHKIDYIHIDKIDMESYVNYDLNIILSYTLADYHTHDIIKKRIIIKGNGLYYFKPNDNLTLELHLIAGDVVYIPPNMKHKFVSFGQTTILKSK